MKVVEIVELVDDVLFAVKWEGDNDHCLNEMLENYTDAEWLRTYLRGNREYLKDNYSIERMVGDIVGGTSEMVEMIYDKAKEESQGLEVLAHLFEDLGGNRAEFVYEPKKAKGTTNVRKLRIYAVKNEYDRYYITGSAIKLTQRMDEHPDTAEQLTRLKIVDTYLEKNKDEI